MTNSNVTCVNGVLAGLYSVSWKTTNENKDQVRVDATIDLTGCKLEDMVKWGIKSRVIDRQKVERTMAKEKIPTKLNIHVNEMGKGTREKSQGIVVTLANIMIANGVPSEKAIERATKVANDPVKLKEMMALVGMLDE